MRSVLRWMLPVAAQLCALPAMAADAWWVVLGSFNKIDSAEVGMAKADELGQPLVVQDADTAGGVMHRLMAGPYEDKARALDFVASAHSNGFAGAWVLREANAAPPASAQPGVEAEPEIEPADIDSAPAPLSGLDEPGIDEPGIDKAAMDEPWNNDALGVDDGIDAVAESSTEAESTEPDMATGTPALPLESAPPDPSLGEPLLFPEAVEPVLAPEAQPIDDDRAPPANVPLSPDEVQQESTRDLLKATEDEVPDTAPPGYNLNRLHRDA